MELVKKYNDFFNVISNNVILSDDYVKNKWKKPKTLDENVLNMVLEDIEDDYEYVLKESEKELILFASSSLAWTNSNESFIYGGFKINGLWEALVVKSSFWKIDFSLAPDAEVPEELKHFEQLNWFEQQAWADDWRYGCFIREKGVFPPKIAFFDKNWYTPMGLDLEGYFDAMFASCAVQGWQYFYIDYNQEIPHLEKAVEDMERAVKLLPKLFPDMDFSYHAQKLEELKQIKNL